MIIHKRRVEQIKFVYTLHADEIVMYKFTRTDENSKRKATTLIFCEKKKYGFNVQQQKAKCADSLAMTFLSVEIHFKTSAAEN